MVKDKPIHADFLRLSENSRINLMIPVEFTNDEECPGLRQGGVLTVVRGEIEMKVLASEIPEDTESSTGAAKTPCPSTSRIMSC